MKKIILIFLVICITPTLLFAKNLEDALNEASQFFTKTLSNVDPGKQLIIQVVNYHSKKSDSDAKEIETDFYFILEKHLPSFKLVLLDEARAGISDSKAIYLHGSYEKKGDETILRFQALKGSLSGIIMGQKMVKFESEEPQSKSLVAVLDFDSNFLVKIQRKIYSDMLRAELINMDAFDMASSADLDKMNPEAIQEQYGCTRDECATIIGEQLGVDRSIATSMHRISENNFVLSANVFNIKKSSIEKVSIVEHHGDLSTLRESIKKLARKLTGGDSGNHTRNKIVERPRSSDSSDGDKAMWAEIKSYDTIQRYKFYISEFPSGNYVSLAKLRIEELKAKKDSALKKRQLQKKIIAQQKKDFAKKKARSGTGPGCGVGSLMFSGSSGISAHSSAYSTNFTFYQSLSITSGTSGCGGYDPIILASNYIKDNQNQFTIELSRGEGEILDNFLSLIQIGENDQILSKQILKNNFSNIYKKENLDSFTLASSISNTLKKNNRLSKYAY